MIPPGRHGGRRRSVNVREVLNRILYVLWTGCQWKALPKGFARPRARCTTISSSGTGTAPWERIHHALYVAQREEEAVKQARGGDHHSQTARRAQKGGLGLIPRATTRARRSRVASGTSWSTRWAPVERRVHPADIRTAMAPSTCCAGRPLAVSRLQ